MSTFNIGSLAGSRTFKESVNTADVQDSYTFKLTAPGSLNASLTNLSANANLRLLNSSSTVLRTSTTSGTGADTISATNLAVGTYTIEVYWSNGNTSTPYTLSLTSDYAGNGISTARNFGDLTRKQTFSDFVGTIDSNDYYKFNLTKPGSLSVELNGSGSTSNLEILNTSGTVLQKLSVANKDSDAVNLNSLSAGTYYVRVYSTDGNVNYNLSLVNDVAIEPRLVNLSSIAKIFYVDTQSQAASDQNPGTQALPYKTITAAAEAAKRENKLGRGVHILIAPGLYRESFDLSGETGSTNAPIVVQALQPGTVKVSGSELYQNWQPLTNDVYAHSWNYDWGVAPNPNWPGVSTLNPVLLRREMVLVNGQLMKQVLAQDQLTEGSFYVSEATDTIFVKPLVGTDMSTAAVEIGERSNLLKIHQRQNVKIEGLVFQNAASFSNNPGTVSVNQAANIQIQDTDFFWNNWSGLKINSSRNVVVRNVNAENNGEKGFSFGGVKNLLVENVEASYNNWRGDWASFYGTDAGQKFVRLRNTIIRSYKAVDNLAKGLWLDYDNENILIQKAFLRGNKGAGLYIEANQGPIAVRNSMIVANNGYGLLAQNSMNVSVEYSKIYNNTDYEVWFENQGWQARAVTRLEGDKTYQVVLENWTFRNNLVADQNKDFYLFRFNQPGNDLWQRFLNSYSSDYNTWYHPGSTNLFQKVWDPYIYYTTSDWQTQTGEDKNSKFALPITNFSSIDPFAINP